MATLTIRQLDDAVYERLKQRARVNQRSLEAEVRTILEGNAHEAVATFLERIEDLHRRFPAVPGTLPDSLSLIREIRDEE